MRNRILLASIVALSFFCSCNSNEGNINTDKRNAKEQKLYGPEVKQYTESNSLENIYPNHGNDQKLATIAADYIGRSWVTLNVDQKSKEFKPDYIDYKFEVDELPIDLKKMNLLFSKEDRIDSKGKRENVIMEFVKKGDHSIRSEHTMIVDFPELANSEIPKVTYGFDKKEGANKKTLHIKKIKSSDFQFSGFESTYFIGTSKPIQRQPFELKYDSKIKKYKLKTETTEVELNLDRTKDLYKGSKDPLFDDMKYCAIISNIKTIQNKYIKSGGYYKIDGIYRFLSNSELNEDFPLREMYKGEALMRHNGTSLSDGQSYVKVIMDDTQIGLIIDVDGYISQYQQVIVDKEKGIVEKCVLIRK